jgi:hypothetical protein
MEGKLRKPGLAAERPIYDPNATALGNLFPEYFTDARMKDLRWDGLNCAIAAGKIVVGVKTAAAGIGVPLLIDGVLGANSCLDLAGNILFPSDLNAALHKVTQTTNKSVLGVTVIAAFFGADQKQLLSVSKNAQAVRNAFTVASAPHNATQLKNATETAFFVLDFLVAKEELQDYVGGLDAKEIARGRSTQSKVGDRGGMCSESRFEFGQGAPRSNADLRCEAGDTSGRPVLNKPGIDQRPL